MTNTVQNVTLRKVIKWKEEETKDRPEMAEKKWRIYAPDHPCSSFVIMYYSPAFLSCPSVAYISGPQRRVGVPNRGRGAMGHECSKLFI